MTSSEGYRAIPSRHSVRRIDETCTAAFNRFQALAADLWVALASRGTGMRSNIGTFALRFAAIAVLFAPAAAAQPHANPSAAAARPAPLPRAHVAPAVSRPNPRSSTLDQTSASRLGTRDGMRESRTYGSERHAAGNEYPHPDRSRETVHQYVYYPSALPPLLPGPALEPLFTQTTGDDAVADGRKAQLRASEPREPPSVSLCSPPYRMTARDGCQR
jgi:hypothetical protein